MIAGIYGDVLDVILLAGAGVILISLVLIARRFTQIATVRGETELIAAKTRRDMAAHEMAKASIQQERQLLALTAPPKPPEEPKAEAKQEEEPVEEVKPRRHDIRLPHLLQPKHEKITDGEWEAS